ncbi:hypothetical protein T552_01903 [Pneumocystis carinii B80]|uniref:Transcription initiation factor IIF subunit alpha n=1 Tax=Pneumocystis carinii (strain B80) TaxID=1408658 RepID=A0A0W4ZI52_PNEC8|nr:hypothetical protein T552_01903 [Pneumocystis carinii B80]KTW28041.1 hypothetical protein T552_01903 [Pneumocystis carinii B80]
MLQDEEIYVKQEDHHGISFSETPTYMDFKLTSVAKSIEGTKHHILKFHSSRMIDPLTEFTPPVRLHRKDLMSTTENQESMSETGSKNNSQETGIQGGNQGGRTGIMRRKTRKGYRVNGGEWRVKQEERVPWVLEDFDGRNTWIGTMEGGQSHNYVFFVFAENGFKVVPANKYYRFNQKSRYQTLSIDEAEAKMNKRIIVPRWFMKKEIKENNHEEYASGPLYRLKTVASQRKSEFNGDRDGYEELDFNEEFADDEETPFIEGNEEDNRELEERIKREMRSANSLGDEDKYMSENAYDEKRKMDKEGRKMRKYLTYHEKNHIYETDEENNPYVSEEETDSDTSNFQRENLVKQEKIIKDKKKQQLQENMIQSELNTNKNISMASKTLSTEVSNSLSNEFTKHLALSSALKAQSQSSFNSISSTRPYLVTLKLPKQHLISYENSFQSSISTLSSPREASPERNKRRKLDSDPNNLEDSANLSSSDSSRKIKIRTINNFQNHNLNSPLSPDSGTDTFNTSESTSNHSYLVTEEELKNAIQSKKMNAKELLKSFKPQLGMNPKNRDLILELVTRIAKMENGYLVLKN